MSRSTIPPSKLVRHSAGARAPAPRSRWYARVYAQLMELLAQMALR
ncbi:MAG TPA: hypothetical protein VN089_02105 [Duganella sp.]|nr:hypothetical protein [Duganella sp.]